MLGFKLHKKSLLEKEIDCVIKIMRQIPPHTDEYSTIAENLERLYKARTESKKGLVSRDMMFLVFGNFVYILAVVGYEQGHVLTSKALQLIVKWRA